MIQSYPFRPTTRYYYYYCCYRYCYCYCYYYYYYCCCYSYPSCCCYHHIHILPATTPPGDDVLPAFLSTQDDTTGRDSKFHGTGGEWTMSEVRYQNPLSKKFLEVASGELGSNDDFNNWDRPQEGAGRFQVSERNGCRESGATAFLEKALERKNLVVRTGAHVRQINFDESQAASGVTYNLVGDDSDMSFSPVLAEGGEVILTGGAIASPQILMASGVGPKSHLEEMGIPVVANVAGVGENLQDHPAAVVSYESPVEGVSVTSKLRIKGTKLNNPLPILKWFAKGKGELTSVGCDHGAFVKTESSKSDQPNLQVRFLPAKALGPDGMTTFTQFRNAKNHADGFSFQSVAVRAKSKGRVRLASSNTQVKPSIDGKYLSDPEDIVTLREGIKLGRKLAAEFGEYLGDEVYPGPEVQSDDEIDEYIRGSVHTANALVGTCKMGDDSMSVVDADLKVKGVKGVRVADSSIFPSIVGGQTGTPTVMVAERAADLIKTGKTLVTVKEKRQGFDLMATLSDLQDELQEA